MLTDVGNVNKRGCICNFRTTLGPCYTQTLILKKRRRLNSCCLARVGLVEAAATIVFKENCRRPALAVLIHSLEGRKPCIHSAASFRFASCVREEGHPWPLRPLRNAFPLQCSSQDRSTNLKTTISRHCSRTILPSAEKS